MADPLPAYRVPRSLAPCDLRLDANEGAVPPADLLDGLDVVELMRRYPDAAPLEAAIAARLGRPADEVLVTAGADDGLDRCCRAFLGPDRALVFPAPGFAMVPRYVRLAGAAVVAVPWREGPYPVAAALSAAARGVGAVLVTSPNNPTGLVATAADLDALAAAGVPRIVDLAYAEFGDEDLTDAALAQPGAVVLRSLSKAWGLAGLRVGYAVGEPATIARLRACGAPYPVSGLALAVAARALARGDEGVRATVAATRAERQAIEADLAALGHAPVPSQANFVLARVPDARWLRDGLAGLGIAVRAWEDDPDLADAVRIGCPGDPAALARLRSGIAAVLAPEALLLDLDGVLADVSRSYREAIVTTAASFGVAVSAADVRAAKAKGDANNDWVVTWRLVTACGVPATLAEVTDRFEAAYQGTEAAPGLWTTETPLLDAAGWAALRARFGRIAVVTGRPRADAVRFLGQHGFGVDALVTMEDAPLKPDPAPVRRALAALGVRAAWMVGDTVDDVRAARAAGVVPLGVLAPGDRDPEPLLRAGAARVLPSLSTLLELA